MYTPPMFKPDRAASLAFAQARGFGTVCAWDGSQADRLVAAVLAEFADDGTPHAAFHVARHNPLIKFGGRDLVLADGGERRGCLCVGRTGTSRRTRCRPGSIRRCI